MTGFKSKRVAAITGRGGNAAWSKLVQDLIHPDIRVLTSATVDNQTWYTVKLSMPAEEWLRLQPKQDWCKYLASDSATCFDISEKMYSAMCLKWS